MTLDPWAMVLVGTIAVIVIVRVFIWLDQSSDRRDAARRNHVRRRR